MMFVAALLGLSAYPPAAASFDQNRMITTLIREKLDIAPWPEELWLGCELVHTGRDLIRFYRERDFFPVWVDRSGVNPQGRKLPEFLDKTRFHGLDPEDYHLACIRGLLEAIDKFQDRDALGLRPDPELLAQFDILLTDGFLSSASHLSSGRVSPENLYKQWLAPEKKEDIISRLATLGPAQDLMEVYEGFLPDCRRYKSMLRAGKRLRRIIAEGGWGRLTAGPLLQQGDTGPRVAALKQRLLMKRVPERGLDVSKSYFDGRLEEAVIRFQSRHGLKVDGLVGRQTLAALNVSAAQRLKTVMLNLERLRWLPCGFKNRYILVNIADFTLAAYENHEKEFSLKVVVGEKYHKTPVFSKELRYIVLNPYWNVPRSIAVKEVLPKIKKDPGYMREKHYQLLSGWQDETLLNPRQIDWDQVNARNFKWRIRQEPGPWNSLGQVKFMFPNVFDVYIHDTPQKHLFKVRERTFSHGCIRCQDPVLLAAFVL
ncbi:MAG: L,D-transpeptidase family protein, partial [Desulfohalobiaceae bacterium]|nr:L,D-transpeptidase family protein [Desulfohalobiaceae bacterium]